MTTTERIGEVATVQVGEARHDVEREVLAHAGTHQQVLRQFAALEEGVRTELLVRISVDQAVGDCDLDTSRGSPESIPLRIATIRYTFSCRLREIRTGLAPGRLRETHE